MPARAAALAVSRRRKSRSASTDQRGRLGNLPPIFFALSIYRRKYVQLESGV
jgi:hypothetical protein